MTLPLIAACLALVVDSGPPPGAGLAPPAESYVHRHYFGVQIGGSSPFALTYRYRIAAPVLLDVGGFGAPEALALSTVGVVLELRRSGRWVLYTGVGGSGNIVGDAGLVFVYGRLGTGLKLGDRRQHQLALDVGVWWGTISRSDHETHLRLSTDRLLIPMAGLAYFVGWGD